jgi:hypothetical protein
MCSLDTTKHLGVIPDRQVRRCWRVVVIPHGCGRPLRDTGRNCVGAVRRDVKLGSGWTALWREQFN